MRRGVVVAVVAAAALPAAAAASVAWSVSFSPPPRSGTSGALFGVKALSATSAAGNSVVLHWTGTAWQQETTPATSGRRDRDLQPAPAPRPDRSRAFA